MGGSRCCGSLRGREATRRPLSTTWQQARERSRITNGSSLRRRLDISSSCLLKKDGFVVDPFCGGGMTPAACIALERQWAAFEIDEATISNAAERVIQSLNAHVAERV